MSSVKSHKSHAPGWLRRLPGVTKPFRGRFPMRVTVPMTEDMVAFLDVHATELSDMLETKVERSALVREAVARIAWDHFGIDVDSGD